METKEKIRFEFPTWDDDTGHSEHETSIIKHDGENYIPLEFVNGMIEGFNCHLSIIPVPMDKNQTKLVV